MLVGADPKAGKSMVALELGRALSTGTAPFEYHGFSVPDPTKTLYIDQEVGERGLKDRGLTMFRGDMDLVGENLYYVSKDPELMLSDPRGVARLDGYIRDVNPGVLILDPIGRLHAYDENDNTQIGALFHTLDRLIRKYREADLSIILIHHMRKKGSDTQNQIDPLSFHNYRGSSRFPADPDTLVTINRLENIRSEKGGKAWKIAVRWETRQAEGPGEDMVMTVNAKDDLRVRYAGVFGGGPPKLKPEEVEKRKLPPVEQLSFQAA